MAEMIRCLLTPDAGNALRSCVAILVALSLSSCGGFFVGQNTVTSLTVSPTNPTLQVGATSQFSVTGRTAAGNTLDVTPGATYTSTRPSVATVAIGGLATALSAGVTTINVSYQQGFTQTFITVTSATLTSISVAPTAASLSVGATQQYTATGTYSDSTTNDLTGLVTWTSSANNVATISSTGLATGVASGSTTITATYTGVTGQTGLTVH